MARPHAAEQTGGGAGIAHVEDVSGFGQAANATASDAPCAVGIVSHFSAQGTHGGGSAQHVFPRQQAGDAGFANRQRAKHQGAMADGLVARHDDLALHGGFGPSGGEWAERGFVHGAGPVRNMTDCVGWLAGYACYRLLPPRFPSVSPDHPSDSLVERTPHHSALRQSLEPLRKSRHDLKLNKQRISQPSY